MPRWNILVVEDDPSLQQLYRLDFEEAGLDLLLASNGLEAAKILVNWSPDLIITDVRMPEAGGESVLDLVEMNYPAIPVIIVSAYKHYQEQFEKDHRNILDFYLKPVNFRELADFVKTFLDRRGNTDTSWMTPPPGTDHPYDPNWHRGVKK